MDREMSLRRALDTTKTDREMLLEAHRFLNAQAYEREEMEDFCRRLNDHLGIPNDTTGTVSES